MAVSRPVGRFFVDARPGRRHRWWRRARPPCPGALSAYAPGLVGFSVAALLTRALYVRGRPMHAALAVAAGWALAGARARRRRPRRVRRRHDAGRAGRRLDGRHDRCPRSSWPSWCAAPGDRRRCRAPAAPWVPRSSPWPSRSPSATPPAAPSRPTGCGGRSGPGVVVGRGHRRGLPRRHGGRGPLRPCVSCASAAGSRRRGGVGMRVVMLVGRSTGGIGTHVVDLAADLRDEGDEVAVVTDRAHGRAVRAARTPAGGGLGRSSGRRGSRADLRRLRRLVRGRRRPPRARAPGRARSPSLVTAGTGTPVVVSQHNAVLGGRPATAGSLDGSSSAVVARRRRPRHRAPAATSSTRPRGTVPATPGWRRCRRRACPACSPDRPWGSTSARPRGRLLLATVEHHRHRTPRARPSSRIAPQKALDVLLDARRAAAHPGDLGRRGRR